MLKGLFFHVFAKIIFVLCTFIVHLYLGKTLSPSEYGTIGVVISIITVNYNFLSNGLRQAVSKLLASQKYDEGNLITRGIIVQSFIAFVLTAINWIGADLFSSILNAGNMSAYIKLSALIIPFTAGHFLSLGIINGLKIFVVEAAIASVYPLLRLTIIPYVSIVFSDSAIGAVMGFFTASFVCFCSEISYLLYRKPRFVKRNLKVATSDLMSNMGSFLIFFTCVTVILNSDMLFVNALITNESHVGYYTGAVNFAKVSYYLLSAIYIVALPAVSQAHSQNSVVKERKIINSLSKIIIFLVMPVISIASATSKSMLVSFYKEEYAYASGTAAILMCSQFLIGLFVVISICISATEKNGFSTILSIVMTILDMWLCYGFIQKYEIAGAAVASLIIGLLGCVVSYVKLTDIYGNIFDKASIRVFVYNVLLFMFVSICFKNILITNMFFLLIIYAVIYFTYLAILILTKQINIKNTVQTLTEK